mgnify:CR=1 FL=1
MKNSSPKKKSLKEPGPVFELNWDTKESRDANLKFICGKLNENVVSNTDQNSEEPENQNAISEGAHKSDTDNIPKNVNYLYPHPSNKLKTKQHSKEAKKGLDGINKSIEYSFSSPSGLEQVGDPYKKFIKAVELSPSIVLIVDRQGIIEFANTKFLETSGYLLNEVVGKGLELFKSDYSTINKYKELRDAVFKGDKWEGELVNKKRDGESFIFSASVSPVENDFGFITNFVILGQDVTPFRETEMKLKSAVEEKTVLLSELHHRVKNNLAIISGLIQLQAFNEPDEAVQSKLLSSVGRVQTMASMHELLYESGSFSKVDFGQNVAKIVNSIGKMYYEKNKQITVNMDIEPVKLNINQAHPCSLILNEVITNAYKHAFNSIEKSGSGKIHIQIYTQKKSIYISIVDNGIGLPWDLKADIEKQSLHLGSTLLNTLVSQLNGSYQYTSDKYGTTFTLNFSREDIRGAANAAFV